MMSLGVLDHPVTSQQEWKDKDPFLETPEANKVKLVMEEETTLDRLALQMEPRGS